ncbi:D-sedoheptulose 7-phosphate isomerase [Candidatus Pseudothioglobus singularis]|jgi:D-sedoheptulose 7-phosphate isomerase|nr:D-sedoheptulose 7-phosphate isomerase [Candidatus Pseudothioglobus singularis]
MKSIIQSEFIEHLKTSRDTMEAITEKIDQAASTCIDCLKKDNKVLICGNGGSAADAQHIAAEIVGRYKTDRKGLPAIALTTDTSAITAISNDFGYLNVFDRQIEALARESDVLIGISTGGSSENVINGIKRANQMKCKTIGLSGKDGGMLNSLCDLNIVVPSEDTARIQEMHILIGHIICQLIDNAFDKH